MEYGTDTGKPGVTRGRKVTDPTLAEKREGWLGRQNRRFGRIRSSSILEGRFGMKNIIATVRLFAVSAALVLFAFVAEAKAQIFSQSPLSLQTLSAELTSPEKIARYLWRNFAYEKDQSQFGTEEYWQSADQFLSNRKGDCEDFALLASELLKQSGRTAFIVNIYGSRYAHTICIYIENGKYNAIDGSDLKRVNADDLKSLISKINPSWTRAAITDISEETNKGKILKLITKKTA